MDIVILGSGNLATNLSAALVKVGHKITQIYSRNIDRAEELSKKYGTIAIDDISLIRNEADLYIIAITDKEIGNLISKVDFEKKNVVHTAGSVPLSIFPKNIEKFGVLYPFQTFSKKRQVDFSDIPICVEANVVEFEEFLFNFARQLSDNVLKMNSQMRKQVHLSGVFACNFVNHLYYVAGNILSKYNIDENIIKPLIRETAEKIMDLPPLLAQTGPALRNDTESIKKHLDLLSSSPEYQQLYKLISDGIYSTYRNSEQPE
ncbi:MAG: Rossmann-like and DUF2520 domain-containing protein [Bacteroidota bacterium]